MPNASATQTRPQRVDNSIDREEAARMTCPHCGHRGLRYEGWRDGRGTYHAEAVCPACGYAEEF